jgi:hypothetical protein
VAHYLVIDPQEKTVQHFWQGEGRALCIADTVDLTPPGLALPVRRCFAWR